MWQAMPTLGASHVRVESGHHFVMGTFRSGQDKLCLKK